MANTKIIKLTNGTLTYVPVTVAAAVQYDYGSNSYTSVQEAIGITAGSVADHIGNGIELKKTAGSNNISLSGTAHNASGSVSIEGGAYINIDSSAADKFIISGYNIAKNDHTHNIGFSGDITLSSTTLGTSLSPTVNKSTNIKGGAAKKIAYQTGANTTGFINAPSTSGQVLKYNGTTIDWGTDEDHKLTSATITPKSSAESIAVTTYSVDVLKSNTITMSGTDGESVTATNVQHYTVPTQNAIDKAKAEAIAHANSLVVSAMNYRGVTSTSLTDGATTNPVTITSGPSTGSVTCVSGDIVLDGTGADKKEYIWNGTSWNELGDASAKANKTTKIISDNTGIVVTDETLADDVHIAHETSSVGTSNPTVSNKNVTGTTGQQKVITGITVNSYGHVTAYTAANIYSTDANSAKAKFASKNGKIVYTYISPSGNSDTTNGSTIQFAEGNNITITRDSDTKITISSSYSDTHYSSKNIVGASNGTADSSQTTNGNVYLRHLEWDGSSYTATSTHKISGSTGIKVTSDGSGNISIAHTHTDISAQSTEALYKIKYDAQGHITGGSSATIKVTPHDSGLKVKIGPDTTNEFGLFADSQFTQTISLADLTQVTAVVS